MTYKTENHFLPSNCYGSVVAGAKKGACIHHAYATSLQACFNALKSRGLSTYAAIHNDTVWILMPDYRCAEWATGVSEGNNNYISVELINESLSPPYKVSGQTIDTYCQFIADLTKQGKIVPTGGKYAWNKAGGLMPHRSFSATACPGDYLMDKGASIAAKINEYMTAKTVADLQIYGANFTDAQLWHPNWIDNRWFYLTNVACGLNLDVAGGANKVGAAVRVAKPNKTAAQQFRLKRQVNKKIGYSPASLAPCELIPRCAPDKSVTLVGHKLHAGNGLGLSKVRGLKTQGFAVVDFGDGNWLLLNPASTCALDVVGGGK